jgi:hypothetical protein
LQKKTEHILGVFTKYPISGQVKTRLIPVIGAQKALEIHEELVRRTLTLVLKWQRLHSSDCMLFFDGSDAQRTQIWLQGLLKHSLTFSLRQQVQGDLGAKMAEAFQEMFAQGYKKAVLIGTDCPLITPEILMQAFEALSRSEAVFGPALDGGYYLLGLNRPERRIFQRITWSSSTTLQQSLQRCREIGLSYTLLKGLPDVDRPEDLQYLTFLP